MTTWVYKCAQECIHWYLYVTVYKYTCSYTCCAKEVHWLYLCFFKYIFMPRLVIFSKT